MKAFTSRVVTALILGAAVFSSPLALAKDKVVLSLQQDPAGDGQEAACVALQLGTGLLMSKKKKAEVTIFATLDGVYIADEDIYNGDDSPICDTINPAGVLGEAPLRNVLENFLDAGGEVLLCPLCFRVRQPFTVIDDPQIYVASPIPLLLEAKKVIDY